MREKNIEAGLKVLVESRSGIYIKLLPFVMMGLPDRLILWPGGVAHFVELKRPDGPKFSPLQLWWHKRLRSYGFRVEVINTQSAINEYMNSI